MQKTTKTKTIKVDATKRGFPAMWETGGGLTSGGSAMLITKRDGSKPRAVFVKTSGHRSGGPHALICVHEGFYLVYASVARGVRSSARIERIVSTSVKDIDGEKWEASAEVEVINTFGRGEWDAPVETKLEEAVETAFKKASIYHCRSAMYIDASERPAPSATDRKKRDQAIARQNAERAAKRQAKAEREAREKAEAEAASKAAKAAGLGDRLEALQPRLAVIRANNPNTGYGELKLDEAYFSLGWGQKLYTEENVASVERSVANWEEQSAERMHKQKARDQFQPQFEAFASRVEALGLSLDFGIDSVECHLSYSDGDVTFYCNYFEYNEESLHDFGVFLSHVEQEVAQKAEKARIEDEVEATYQQQKAKAASMGLPQNVKIWRRLGGRTNAGNGWVIASDGVEREPTSMYNANPRRLSRYGEGYMVWEQILEGEVVLAWSKATSAAHHEFEIVHMPEEGLTNEQLTYIAMIEEELDKQWENARGLASGLPSPPVGDGWGLGTIEMRYAPVRTEEVWSSEEVDSDEDDADSPDLETALGRLQSRFGK